MCTFDGGAGGGQLLFICLLLGTQRGYQHLKEIAHAHVQQVWKASNYLYSKYDNKCKL